MVDQNDDDGIFSELNEGEDGVNIDDDAFLLVVRRQIILRIQVRVANRNVTVASKM